MRNRLLAIVAVLALGAVTAAAEGGERPPPIPRASYRLEASAALLGLPVPYRLHFLAERHGEPSDLIIALSRRYPGDQRARQTHQWAVNQGGTFGCQPDLSRCTVGDAGTFGRLASIRMRFEPAGEPSIHEHRCAKTGELLGTTTEQRGRLIGSVRLDTRSEFFGVVGNGSSAVHTRTILSATVAKFVSTLKSCPEGPRRCPEGGEAFTRGSGPQTLFWFDLFSRQFVTLGFRDLSPVSGLDIMHFVVSRPAAFVLDEHAVEGGQRLDSATLRLGSLSPVVRGDLEWTGTGKPRFIDEHKNCLIIHRRGTFDGDVVARLDGFGERAWPGPVNGFIAIGEPQ